MTSARMQSLDQRFAVRRQRVARGVQTWREAGRGDTVVLLHGIGSGALGWAAQLEALGLRYRVLAWDAPGYGESTALPVAQPMAADYVQALAEWLQLLDTGPVVLVGHSLGAIVAAAAAAQRAIDVRAVMLASPALGYGDAAPELRAQRLQERLDIVHRLGPAAMAEQRAPGLCTPGASAEVIEQVRWNMARVTPQGYAQAAYLLAHEVLSRHARQISVPWRVCAGDADRVTPCAQCRAFAEAMGAAFDPIPGAAHACPIEHPQAFNAVLANFIASLTEAEHD